MGLLFCGSVPQSFEISPAGLRASNSGNFTASSFAPEALEFRGDTWGVGRFPPQPELWVSLRWRCRDRRNTQGLEPMMLRDGGQPWIGVRVQSGSSGELSLVRWDGSDWQVLADFAYGADTTYAWHFHVVTGSAGVIQFRVHDELLVDWSGDLSGMPELDNIKVGPASTSTSQFRQSGMSEIIVANEETRRMRLQSLPASAEGAAFAWSGSISDVADGEPDDDFFAATETAGERILAQHPGLGSDTLDVRAVVLSTRIRREDGPEEVAGLVRVDGAEYQTDAVAITSEFGPEQFIFEANPASSAFWDRSAVEELEFGLVSVAP